MFKKTMRWALLPAAAAVLVACGGGGGSDMGASVQPSNLVVPVVINAVPPQ